MGGLLFFRVLKNETNKIPGIHVYPVPIKKKIKQKKLVEKMFVFLFFHIRYMVITVVTVTGSL
jgi:hypothetical protein